MSKRDKWREKTFFFLTKRCHCTKRGELFISLPNVLKTGPVTELKKLLVHGSLVGPAVEPRLNVMNILFIYYLNFKTYN